MLSIAEIKAKVVVAELETARNKSLKGRTKKRKRPEVISEDEENLEESSAIEESDIEDCIVVGRC